MTERSTPRVENAPGIVWRTRKEGWVAEWHARRDLVKRGFRPGSVPLWRGETPTETDAAHISDQCNKLQSEMLVWGRGGLPSVGTFDGTLGDLIKCYQTDPDSPYRKLRYKTRINYAGLLRRIDREFGAEPIDGLKARHFLRWHEEWTKSGIATAHGLIGMVRTLFGFGATIIEDDECERLTGILHRMRFEMPKARNERITSEQVNAIRAKAHEMGLPSIALVQAFQFELMLRQKDVIGEWVPQSEPGTSDVINGPMKWLRGIRWSEIDQNLVLRHTTSKRQKDIEVNLRLAPMVMEELAAFGGALPASGPIIICEATGLPYKASQFRYYWRNVAKAAGVPDQVFNMDSRAGAITEATDAGAELEHIRHAATHSDISMTQRYSRGSVEKAANVMQMRAAHRNKPGK